MYIAHINDIGDIQTCTEHSRNAAKIAAASLQAVHLEHTAELAGLLHDCGKFTDEFTRYISDSAQGCNTGNQVIHSFAGVSFILDTFHSTPSSLGYKELTAELIAYAIGAHHGQFDIFNESSDNGFVHRLQKQPDYDRKAIEAFVAECTGTNEIEKLFTQAVKEVTAVFDKVKSISKNNDELFFYLGLVARLITSAVVNGDRTDTASFMRCGLPTLNNDPNLWDNCIRNIEALMETFTATTPIQMARKTFSDACKDFSTESNGIYRLNLPTGSGKTLAGLRYALYHAKQYSKQRIIYCAPLISIIEQNADVIRSAIQNDDLILEHHSGTVDEQNNTEDLDTLELVLSNWNKPIIVTTLVRMLYTMFKGKMSSVRRFHALCDSVIIFDEIQSLPKRMISMFNLAANFLANVCNSTIILCSATSPSLEFANHSMRISERKMIPEEIYKKNTPQFKRTNIHDIGSLNLDEIPSWAMNVVRDVNSLLIICNTKREATAIYDGISQLGIECCHLSAGMCMSHRKRTLERLKKSLESSSRIICVSTQVIEAGIDISFDCVIRLSAGLDSVVQAAGRCNRNGESDEPKDVYIATCQNERLGSLHEIIEGQDALSDLLAQYKMDPDAYACDLASELSVQYYYRRLYSRMDANAQDYPIKDSPTLFSMLSWNKQYASDGQDSSRYLLRQAFKKAGELFDVFDSDTQAVITPYDMGSEIISELQSDRVKYDLRYLQSLIEQSRPYTVTIFSNLLPQMLKEKIIYPICSGKLYALNEEYYSINTGIITNNRKGETTCDTLIL